MHAHDSPAAKQPPDGNLSVIAKAQVPILPTPTLELLPARSLVLRPPYGRLPGSRRLAWLRKNWMPAAIGTLSVSRRADGSTAVIDGTHRGTIALEIGAPELIPCQVYEGLSLADEAGAYLRLNDVLPQSALDLFRTELDAGNADSIAINNAIEDAGLKLRSPMVRSATGHSAHRNAVACVMTMRKIMARYGVDHLADTLAFMSNVFDGQGTAINAGTLPAFAGVLDIGKDIKHFDRGHLHKVISDVGIAKLHGLGENVRLRTLVPQPVAVAVAIADLYNRNRRTGKLPRSPLAPLPKEHD